MSFVDFSDLNGKTITSIKGLEQYSGEVEFKTSCGCTYIMYHEQVCCESVLVEDFDADLTDLIGSTVINAEEVSNYEYKESQCAESYTWTFYKIQTSKGGAWIRWLGESNGYYSERVSFEKVEG